MLNGFYFLTDIKRARKSQALESRYIASNLLKNNEERATSTGILFSTISISGAAGPFLGGVVAQFWGFQPLMYFAAGFCLAGFGVARARTK